MHGARFGSTNLTGVDLRDATSGLDDADLRGLLWRCIGCNLRGASIAGRDLSGVSIVGSDLRIASARGVRFAGADLQGVDFSNADLRQADFRNARLCSRNEEGRIGCVDFRGANLQGADLRGALLCTGGRESRNCEPVDAATLRRGSNSNLDGAIL
jgi:uncharacterized protein YjbI with pentapeptide repeats